TSALRPCRSRNRLFDWRLVAGYRTDRGAPERRGEASGDRRRDGALLQGADRRLVGNADDPSGGEGAAAEKADGGRGGGIAAGTDGARSGGGRATAAAGRPADRQGAGGAGGD